MLDPYAEDLFRTLFNLPDLTEVDQRGDIPMTPLQQGSSIPLCIKYLFDFLDDEFMNNRLSDPAILHSWKSNWFAEPA